MLKESKKYKWILVALLWVVALLNYMDRQMLSTMRPAMQVDIHELQSATNFGYLMGIQALQWGSIVTASLCVLLAAVLQYQGWRRHDPA